jgi:hypothetical protein
MKTNILENKHGFICCFLEFQKGDTLLQGESPSSVIDENGWVDTSSHIGFVFDGLFKIEYPGLPPIIYNGRATKGVHPITQQKGKHPAGVRVITCQQAGSLFYVLPRDPQTKKVPETENPLVWDLLDAGEVKTVPKPGFFIPFSGDLSFSILETPDGVFTAPYEGVLFWRTL